MTWSGQPFPALAGFDFVRVLGEGGAGTVYLARQLSLDRLVAIKKLMAMGDGAESLTKRFRREARATARLTHPNIVQVYDFVACDGNLYLVLEYVEGPTLRQVQDRLTRPTALHIISQLVSAIGYASRHGIAHRDLKPENVLISSSGQCKLTDFGIARVFSETAYGGALSGFHTQAANILGTAAYISPEAAEGRAGVDHRADLYSLGVITYELLVGQLPFSSSDSLYAAILAHTTQPVPRPTMVSPGFPPAVEAVLLQALSKAPSQRQRNVQDFWLQLEAAAGRAWPQWQRSINLNELTSDPELVAGYHEEPAGSTRVASVVSTPPPHPSASAATVLSPVFDARTTVLAPPLPGPRRADSFPPSALPTSGRRPDVSQQGLWRPARARRRNLLAALAAAILLSAGLIGLLLTLRSTTTNGSPLAVTDVTVATAAPAGGAHCPQATINFRARIDTNGGSGVLRYQWIYPDHSPGTVRNVRVPYKAGPVIETLQFTYTGPRSAAGAATLHVLTPNDVLSPPASVVYQCP
jgi:serine/threonine protein kinase